MIIYFELWRILIIFKKNKIKKKKIIMLLLYQTILVNKANKNQSPLFLFYTL
jgi:hypothetical protein